MPGTFDEIIRQQMRGSQRGLGYQDARDRAARQMNMAATGLNSTAMPSPTLQPPAQPPSMDSLIQAQLGEEMPVPGPRPMQEPAPQLPIEMGDARVAENSQLPPSPVDDTIAQQIGVDPMPTTPPMPVEQMALPSQVIEPGTASAEAANRPGEQSFNPTNLIATVIALGGAAGVASLIQRYKMGDPNAANTFRSIGISPDELATFAGDVMPQRDRGTQAAPKSNNQKSSGGNEGAKKSDASSADEKAGSDGTGKKSDTPFTQRFIKKNKSPPGKTSGVKPVRPKVRMK